MKWKMSIPVDTIKSIRLTRLAANSSGIKAGYALQKNECRQATNEPTDLHDGPLLCLATAGALRMQTQGKHDYRGNEKK